ncbi:MAG: hypothetical protein WCT12_21860, partial [Verrucomicrobiota bacterium]
QVIAHGCRLWNYLQAKSVKLLGPFRRPADWFAKMRTSRKNVSICACATRLERFNCLQVEHDFN